MSQFQRVAVSQADFVNRDLRSEIKLFGSDETPVEQVIDLINIYYSGILYDQKNPNQSIDSFSNHYCIKYMFEQAIRGSVRNASLLLSANLFFGHQMRFWLTEGNFGLSSNEFGISFQPLENLRQLLVYYMSYDWIDSILYQSLLAEAEKNPDERVKYYLKYSQNDNHTQWDQHWEQAATQQQKQDRQLVELQRDATSYLSQLPRDITEYVIRPYLKMYYRYLQR